MMSVPPLFPAIFLDRDGTLMEEVHYCRDPALVRLFPRVNDSLRALQKAGFKNIIITNQSGIGRGKITLPEYHAVHSRLLELIGPDLIAATYFCPDTPAVDSLRRKPAPGMLLEAARELSIDLARSWFVGDKAIDIQCGHAAGTRAVLVQTGYGNAQSVANAEFVTADFARATELILAHS